MANPNSGGYNRWILWPPLPIVFLHGAVIAAEFGDAEADGAAVEALRRHCPGCEVVTLNVDPLGELGGGIHCATHEQPAA